MYCNAEPLVNFNKFGLQLHLSKLATTGSKDHALQMRDARRSRKISKRMIRDWGRKMKKSLTVIHIPSELAGQNSLQDYGAITFTLDTKWCKAIDRTEPGNSGMCSV